MNSPHAGGQEPEIQTFGTLYTPDSGNFALEFTDEFGDNWVTETLDWTATAAQVEAALEALPNSVVEDVIVHKYDEQSDPAVSVDIDGSTATRVTSWTITFIKNSGDVPTLGVRYTATVNALNSGAGITETDNGGQFTTLSSSFLQPGSIDDNDLAMAIGVCGFRTCPSGSLEPDSLQLCKSFWTLLLTRKSFSTRLEDLVPRRTLCARTVVCAITVRDFASVSMDLPMMTAVVRTLLRCNNFTDVFFSLSCVFVL